MHAWPGRDIINLDRMTAQREAEARVCVMCGVVCVCVCVCAGVGVRVLECERGVGASMRRVHRFLCVWMCVCVPVLALMLARVRLWLRVWTGVVGHLLSRRRRQGPRTHAIRRKL